MSSLFDLTGKYLKLKQLAEDGADEQLIQDTMESIDDEIERKADGYASVIKHLESNVEMVDKEIKRLQAFKKTHQNTIKRMKENLIEGMKATEKTKFKTELNHFYIKKNQVALEVEHKDNIPKEFYEINYELDKQKLKDYLKKNENEEIDGVRLTQSESVIIK